MTAASPTTPTSPTAVGRALDLYRRTATSRSAIALVVANAIPLIGVLFFGWSLLTILVLFWVENGIVGLWNVPRILLARGSILQALPDMPEEAAFNATGNAQAAAELRARWEAARVQVTIDGTGRTPAVNPIASALLNTGSFGRASMALFFLVHYGMFWLVHGIFVFALPTFAGFGRGGGCIDNPVPAGLPANVPPDLAQGSAASTCASPFGEVVWSNVAIAAVALFLSHGAAFALNYVGKKEYLTTSAARQMFAPYSRVVMLHLTIIFGAFVIAILGAPIGALVVLVVVKTVFDLGLHVRQGKSARGGVLSDAEA
jgi:hypothetical protein